MKKSLTVALAALTFGGAIVATALPAQARDHDGWRGGYGHRDWDRHYNRDGAAVVAGIAGLALGAALVGSSHPYRPPTYGYGYYGGYYDPPPVYRLCEARRWVWDPYIGREVLVRSHYAC